MKYSTRFKGGPLGKHFFDGEFPKEKNKKGESVLENSRKGGVGGGKAKRLLSKAL